MFEMLPFASNVYVVTEVPLMLVVSLDDAS
jgi:hypothetical protein